MIHPFQQIVYCGDQHQGKLAFLFAASGAWIYSFNAADGSFLCRWSHTTIQDGGENSATIHDTQSRDSEEGGPDRPGKRRKLIDVGGDSESTSTEIVVDKSNQPSKKQKAEISPAPAIIKLTATPNGRHLVAVTGEDKCIRVLKVLADGGLDQLSKRPMPKKPCSIAFVADGSIILCADKFGDVYALPLLMSETDGKPISCSLPSTSATSTEEPKSTPFIPSANEFTVHTKRNQQALKNQQKVTAKVTLKKNLEFEHQLLLGHVSLLADLACVTLSAEELGAMSPRSYILTSDRDEHIRVSRGLPQTHIIEGYCLEHTEFVSKLCIPPWNQQSLVSGGGDDYLILWDWLNGAVRQKMDLKNEVLKVHQQAGRSTLGADQQSDTPDGSISVAVSGIWAFEILGRSGSEPKGDFIIACEGLSAMIIFSSNTDGLLEHRETLRTEGNVIDVAILPGRQAILYSIDNLHKSNSTNAVESTGQRPVVGSYSYSSALDKWEKNSGGDIVAAAISEWAAGQESYSPDQSCQSATVSDLLYNTDRLRKRGQYDD